MSQDNNENNVWNENQPFVNEDIMPEEEGFSTVSEATETQNTEQESAYTTPNDTATAYTTPNYGGQQTQQNQQAQQSQQTQQNQQTQYTQYSYSQQHNTGYQNSTPNYSNIPPKKKGGFGKTLGIVACAVAGVVLLSSIGVGVIRTIDNRNTKSGTANTIEKTADSPVIATVEGSTQSSASGGVAAVVEETMPSIVSITSTVITTQSDWFGQTYNQQSEGSGSGIIIQQDQDVLYIATNNHVIEDAQKVKVKFVDDEMVDATIKGTDSDADLAIVTVDLKDLKATTVEKIKVAQLGDSDSVKVGETVIAIGNALGYGQSVTQGIVSAKDREVQMTDKTMTLLQTDAAINPGNSGGALLNMSGQVIGINSVKFAQEEVEGMGFAIPTSVATPILNDLIAEREIPEGKQAYLGIMGQTVDSALMQSTGMPEGVFVSSVMEGSAAETAGIRPYDIIVKFGTRDITSMNTLTELLSKKAAGDTVEITVKRVQNGAYKEKVLNVTLQAKPDSEEDSTENRTQDNGQNSPNGNNGNRDSQSQPKMDDIEEFFRQYFGQ
ncbi:MAG: S1C family serine protease [Lachnospiraceae bacterium]